jgi:hypothetical protein
MFAIVPGRKASLIGHLLILLALLAFALWAQNFMLFFSPNKRAGGFANWALSG